VAEDPTFLQSLHFLELVVLIGAQFVNSRSSDTSVKNNNMNSVVRFLEVQSPVNESLPSSDVDMVFHHDFINFTNVFAILRKFWKQFTTRKYSVLHEALCCERETLELQDVWYLVIFDLAIQVGLQRPEVPKHLYFLEDHRRGIPITLVIL
jgi:hypothetical protein